jgi:hypothetical protein
MASPSMRLSSLNCCGESKFRKGCISSKIDIMPAVGLTGKLARLSYLSLPSSHFSASIQKLSREWREDA